MTRFIAIFSFFLCLSVSPSHAQLFSLDITDWGGINDPSVQAYVESQIATLEADINKDLPSAPPKRLMEGMANSSVMAGKGIGTDYASNMDVFLIGAGVGVGADLTKDKETDSDLSGAGVAPGVIVGLNLSFLDAERIAGLDTNRLSVYANFMNYNHKQNLNDKPDEKSDAELDMRSMGVHFKYDWIKKRGSKWLGWGGIKVHWGYEYNRTNIVFNSTINKTESSTSGGETYSGTITGSPSANILATTHSIPLAISTDVQLLYFLSLYGGLGADYNWGQAKGKGNLNGSESTINCTGGIGSVCNGDPDGNGTPGAQIGITPSANIDATGKVNPFIYRGFAGVQLNLPFIRIFGQVDKAFGNNLIGATAGVRIVY